MEYQQEGTEWPRKGIGTASSSGCKAFRALKLMAKHHINLAVMDEEAAINGSRPLEQIADCSGYAWGGAIVQMTGDLTGVKMLAMVGKELNPAQQAWAPLQLEGYAQLETKRAQRRVLGWMRSICWTDHANWIRLKQKPEVDVKCVRCLSEITSDGSVIRSLAGRSAKFADGTSRNCRDRDGSIAQRTADLQGLV